MTVTPAPDEKGVRDALLRVLRELGLDPKDDWISVRVVNAAWSKERTYSVVIAYEPARAALGGVLPRCVGNAEKYAVGVWVLDQSDARALCERTP